jgi:hypothetical protein
MKLSTHSINPCLHIKDSWSKSGLRGTNTLSLNIVSLPRDAPPQLIENSTSSLGSTELVREVEGMALICLMLHMKHCTL